eukprot:gene9255-biopygen16715
MAAPQAPPGRKNEEIAAPQALPGLRTRKSTTLCSVLHHHTATLQPSGDQQCKTAPKAPGKWEITAPKAPGIGKKAPKASGFLDPKTGDFANLTPCPCVGPRGPGSGARQGAHSDYYFLGPCIRGAHSDYYFLGAVWHLGLPPPCKADSHPPLCFSVFMQLMLVQPNPAGNGRHGMSPKTVFCG